MFVGMKRAAVSAFAATMLAASVYAQPAAPAGGAAAPAAPPADLKVLAGNWTTTLVGLPGDPQFGTFSATMDANGDHLSGVVKNDFGEMKIDSIKVNGPRHEYSFNIDAMGQTVDVAVSVKVEGDVFKGDFTVGGGMMTAGIEGAKVGTKAEADLKKKVQDDFIKRIGPPILPVADAKDFLGAWEMVGDSPMGGEMKVKFSVLESEQEKGKVTAKLNLPPPLGTNTVNKLTKTDKGINLSYSMELMGNPMDIVVDIERDGQMLTGLIDAGGGMFQIPFEGVKEGRGYSKMSAGGKTVIVEFGKPSTKGPGYKQMSTVKEGFIWRMGKDASTTLKTDVDLKFGDKVVKAGRYNLWAKKTGSGWNLLVNSEADAPKHNPSSDVAEVPMTGAKTPAEIELLTIEVKGDGSAPGAGNLRLQWGTEDASAKFQMDLPPPPAPAGGAAK